MLLFLLSLELVPIIKTALAGVTVQVQAMQRERDDIDCDGATENCKEKDVVEASRS